MQTFANIINGSLATSESTFESKNPANDIEQAKTIAHRLEAGTVWINHHGAIHPMVPFGGAKRSGWGVEFGVEGLKALTRPHVISVMK